MRDTERAGWGAGLAGFGDGQLSSLALPLSPETPLGGEEQSELSAPPWERLGRKHHRGASPPELAGLASNQGSRRNPSSGACPKKGSVFGASQPRAAGGAGGEEEGRNWQLERASVRRGPGWPERHGAGLCGCRREKPEVWLIPRGWTFAPVLTGSISGSLFLPNPLLAGTRCWPFPHFLKGGCSFSVPTCCSQAD